MSETLTRAEFAKRASYIAQRAAKWASDNLELPERIGEPLLPGNIERFTAEITGMLEALGGRKGAPLPPTHPPIPWIRAYRELYGCGLKEAKEAHDRATAL